MLKADFLGHPAYQPVNQGSLVGFPDFNNADPNITIGNYGFNSGMNEPIVISYVGSSFPPANETVTFFQFTTALPTLTIDYGDGTISTFPCNNNTQLGLLGTGIHTYADGLNIQRTIKLKLSNPELATFIRLFSYNFTSIKYSPFIILQNLSLASDLVLFGEDISQIFNTVTSMVFTCNNNPIALGVFNKPITNLQISGGVYLVNNNFAQSNLDKLVLLKNTLTALNLSLDNATDTTNGVVLPANMSELQIKTLAIGGGNLLLTQIPAVVNTITTITTLSTSRTPLTSWGDLSALVNLVSFSTLGVGVTQPATLPNTVPPWLLNTPQLKTLTVGSMGQGQPNPNTFVDTYISNMYMLSPLMQLLLEPLHCLIVEWL